MEREPRSTCWGCWRPEEACLCAEIHPFETRTHFVLLMHPKEARLRHLGTGRLTRACIPSTSIRVGREFGSDAQVQAWIDDSSRRTFLLYPGGPTLADLVSENCAREEQSVVALGDPVAEHSDERPSQRQNPPTTGRLHASTSAHLDAMPIAPTHDLPIRLLLLDATWAQAKGLLLRSPNLQGLPRISIEPKETSRFNRIRQQPARLCLSTIESVHQWITEANAAGIESTGTAHDVLLRVLDELCRIQLDCASDPDRPGYRRKPYKAEDERVPAGWSKPRKFLVG
ncbi:MAG: DTW domain-containing protein [Candidatus Eisenbacteria bacterium]|nr:DTW domain-containing protein [Candidatus Eisenbacteria bacterium]